MTERPLRIGITGSASTGKTALANALAEKLKLPVVGEEIREFLTSEGLAHEGTGVGALPCPERRRVLEELFAERIDRERVLESFVADNTSLDFTAYALHHGIYDDLFDAGEALLLSQPARTIGTYDAVFLLPHGALPYVRDGVRSDSPVAELRYQHLLESVLRRSFASHRLYALPTDCTDLADRVRYAILVLERAGLLQAHHRPSPGGQPGVVYLVGAGPGDPGLLTVRARELLQRADVVAPDKLVPTELLETLPRHLEILQVGHRGRGTRSAAHRIHPAVLEAARSGKSVVRLKAGDPMIFGRGAEEAEELRAAGIPFEIVPGISAALGAASYAGIPLTHRDDASDVTFVTGHESSSDRPSKTRWDGLGPGTGTVVLYMAAQRLERSLARLVEAGRAPTTPAAYVAGATHVSQRVIVGTLSDLVQRLRNEDRSQPAIVIVGEVVSRRDTIEWLEGRRPLLGRNLLVARARSGASRIASHLRELGALVVESPIVEDVAIPDAEALRAALETTVGAVVVGDATTGRFLRMAAVRLSARHRRRLFSLPAIALTELAASDLREFGVHVAAVARGACTDAVREAVSGALGPIRRRVLVPGHRGGRPKLVAALLDLGLEPSETPVFERRYRFPRTDVGTYDGAVYPSSSAVRAVFEDRLSAQLFDVPAVSIGPETSEALRQAGVRWIEETGEDTIEATIALAMRVLTAPLAKERALR